MDFHGLEALRRQHPAWGLLKADHAPLIASFLHRVFIAPNVRTLAQPEIRSKLEDTLFHLRRDNGPHLFPRTAQAYLDDWASDDHAWLRKYYPADGDEPHFDLTPATEKALVWLDSLSRRQFVGTSSRLATVFQLLRQLIDSTETDVAVRMAELERRRADVDDQIARLRAGELPVINNADAKERFLHATGMAKGLLSDFREVEQNFRDLDRGVREQIATWDGEKGALLDEIFGDRDAIVDSDEGKSFRAFWDFLMSPSRQEELTDLLTRALSLSAVGELKPDRRLLRIHFDWLEAGEVTQRTVARLSEQLRRFIDDKAFLENRRIMQILRDIESEALGLREAIPPGPFMELDAPGPAINLVMERPLFTPPSKPELNGRLVDDDGDVVPSDALFDTVYVDKARLQARIRQALQMRSQISLADLVAQTPLEQGLSELIAYLSLATDKSAKLGATDGSQAVIDDRVQQTIRWIDAQGSSREATMPLVIFARAVAEQAD
jgi:hypothetical protein